MPLFMDGRRPTMRTFLKWLIFGPLAVVVLVFSLFNRHEVPVVFDPFGSDIPGMTLQLPLFLVMFVCLGLGVLAGSLATWLTQGRYRRSARDARAELARLKAATPAPAQLVPAVAYKP